MGRTGTVASLVFVALFFVVGLGLFAYGIQQHGNESILASRGLHVLGTVVDRKLDTVHDSRGSDSTARILDVTYPVGKSFNEGQFQCTDRAFQEHPEGSRIEVVYDPKNPDLALLGAGFNENPSYRFILFGIGCVIAGAGLATWVAIYLRKQKQGKIPDLDEALTKAELGE
ncbi:MAG: DUF3592 domain-containing protein [Fimbriimonadales bacterium]